jgi:hypothetical protein
MTESPSDKIRQLVATVTLYVEAEVDTQALWQLAIYKFRFSRPAQDVQRKPSENSVRT